MSIMNPDIVNAELDKPINVDKEVKLMLEVSLNGKEEETHYTLAEKHLIANETGRIYSLLTRDVTKPEGRKPTFFLTSGGPGSGKTTLIKNLQETDHPISNAVHVDPDEVLRDFTPYTDVMENLGESQVARAAAYTKWRWASIYMANSIINKLAEDGYDIAFGTTGTSPHVVRTYEAAKEAGYKTHLLMVHASESVRLASVEKRFDEEYRFVKQQDVLDKGNKMFPDIFETHFAHAENVDIYWRQNLMEEPLNVMTARNGKVEVLDEHKLVKFMDEITKRSLDISFRRAEEVYLQRYADVDNILPPTASGNSSPAP